VALMPGLAALARRVTKAFYRNDHQIDLSRVDLVPAASILEQQSAVEREEAARARYFGLVISPARPIRFGVAAPPASPEAALRTLREAREQWAELEPAINEHTERMLRSHRDVMMARAAGVLIAAGFVPKEVIGAEIADPGTAESARRHALAERRAAEEALAPARSIVQGRMATVLSLLTTAEVRTRLVDGEPRARQAELLIRALDELADSAAIIGRLRREHTMVAMLMSAEARTQDEAQKQHEQARALIDRMEIDLARLLKPLGAIPYPFEHARGPLSLAAFLTDDMPEWDDTLGAFPRVGHVIGRLYAFHERALGRLAFLAEDVERAVGAS
jgi:hypothetical protein